ncbi:MAG: tetratricopeptide repeat protein [Nitrospirota bacterium]|nr:tetratricopeptide repeat protein [Nitrospirota bacterium]
MKQVRIPLKRQWCMKAILLGIFLMTLPQWAIAFDKDQHFNAEDTVAERAEDAWVNGGTNRALDILNQGIRDHPQALMLKKLQGDIFSTARRPKEAVQAYETVLKETPSALDVRWAKWSVLLRSGQGDQAVAELQRIAQDDSHNPLIPLRMAQELRKLDRLEESLEWYKKAVPLRSDLPSWRLALARARFDILDGRGARDEVKQVLTMVSPGSPEEAAARILMSVIYGATKERGRRYQPIFSPDGTSAERKEWSQVRAESWRLYEAGRFKEAEPLLRKSLVLKPSDYGATYDLGRTLMELGQCKEAVTVFQKISLLNPADLTYADTFFRIGQCLMEMEQWSEALVHFEILYEAAIEFEESSKGVRVKGGIKVLDKEKLARWIAKARKHVPNAKSLKDEENDNTLPTISEEQLYAELVKKRQKIDDPIYTRASLMGRDADFSLFRYVIPASRVMRDDLPGGAHDFIPIDPGDTFPATQQDIYLVFGLVTASYDEVPLTAECFVETSKISEDQQVLTQDHVVMAMSEQTGYFILSPPESGWTPNLYVCGLFEGNVISAYTHADEVRFRIIAPPLPS